MTAEPRRTRPLLRIVTSNQATHPEPASVHPCPQRVAEPGGRAEPWARSVRPYPSRVAEPDRVASPAVRAARAYLLRVAEPPAPALAALVAECGPVRAAELVRAGQVPPDVLAETQARCTVQRVAADLAAAEAIGGRLVVPEDEEWPAWPFTAFGPAAARGVDWAVAPLALWVRGPGRLDELAASAVAVVGARAATSYGDHVAAELGYELADRGVTVVSGAAYGIDGAAHRGALAAAGPTLAVLGCGVDYAYPSGHVGLLRRIAEHGAVVSEYPPGTPPARHRFIYRNRLIAALSGGAVVVEAGPRSGARNTAAAAARLGRVVMAVPGPVTSAMSRGCNTMIREDAAVCVDGVHQVLESVGRLGAFTEPATGCVRRTDGLDPVELRVHEALRPRSARSAQWLAQEAGVPLDRVRAVLPMLAERGLARRSESGWLLAPPQRERPEQQCALVQQRPERDGGAPPERPDWHGGAPPERPDRHGGGPPERVDPAARGGA